jgi:glycosyltransferase involved in cell wall biosynthesis
MLGRAGLRVVFHVRSTDQETWTAGVDVRWFGLNRAMWEEPLVRSGSAKSSLTAERARLDFLALRNDINSEISRHPYARHALASTFVTSEGFLAAAVADDLGLPHVACVVGTDFSRGFREPKGRGVITDVLRRARFVVTFSGEQERALRSQLGLTHLRAIHLSLDDGVFAHRWTGSNSADVVLFSDVGLSFKKGTVALIRAFAQLGDEGLPLRLLLYGGMYDGEEPYWSSIDPHGAELRGHVDTATLWPVMAASDIYVSPTLGEGCSLARSAALSIGMPVVTTRCGEMLDIDAASHVLLAPPADYAAFVRVLREACVAMRDDTLTIDAARVQSWREHFTAERECEEWLQVLEHVYA